MSTQPKVNDLVVKFANVNGSGSASANTMFAKSVFRMGVPVSAKNIFPSNIQGLPTWYEVRINENGYTARRDGVDVMVAMNPQSYAQDLAELVTGGILIYDSSWPRRWEREDITIIGVPIAKLCAERYEDIRQRQLFKNIVYVGVLSVLLDMDYDTIKQLVSDQFAGKTKLIEPNLGALQMGRDYALEHIDVTSPWTVAKSDKTQGQIFTTGNKAAGLGAVYAGATVASWYPITPSTSVVEEFERYLNRFRKQEDGTLLGAVVQAEDELAAAGMAIGANWNGARAFTATSGPGISLMSEFIGLAYFAEIPLVLLDIQRGGPSTGMPTRTQQSDILTCAYASHGDTRHVLLFPRDPNECFSLTADAFDLAERLQTPVFVVSDLDIGMNDWVVDPFEWDDSRTFDRGKVLDAEGLEATADWGRYKDVDGDGIGYRTLPGAHPDKGAYFTRGTSHNEYARYTEDGRIHAQTLDRLNRKFETAAAMVPKPVVRKADKPTRFAILNFGSTDPAVGEAIDYLKVDGVTMDHMRLRAFPFSREVADFINRYDQVFVVEQNRDAQMRQLLIIEAEIAAEKLVPVLSYDGMPVTANFVRETIRRHLEQSGALGGFKPTPVTAA